MTTAECKTDVLKLEVITSIVDQATPATTIEHDVPEKVLLRRICVTAGTNSKVAC